MTSTLQAMPMPSMPALPRSRPRAPESSLSEETTTMETMDQAVALPPQRADWVIDQGWENYTAQEHAVWKTLFERQTALLPERACAELVAGMRDLPIGADRIPDCRALSEVLMRHTGWQVVAVPGLVPDEVFFE